MKGLYFTTEQQPLSILSYWQLLHGRPWGIINITRLIFTIQVQGESDWLSRSEVTLSTTHTWVVFVQRWGSIPFEDTLTQRMRSYCMLSSLQSWIQQPGRCRVAFYWLHDGILRCSPLKPWTPSCASARTMMCLLTSHSCTQMQCCWRYLCCSC